MMKRHIGVAFLMGCVTATSATAQDMRATQVLEIVSLTSKANEHQLIYQIDRHARECAERFQTS